MPHVADCQGNAGNGSKEDPHALVSTVQRAIDEGLYQIDNAQTGAVVAWGLIHGLTSLYLAGHLTHAVGSNDGFLELVDEAMESLGKGLLPRETAPVSKP